MIYLDEAATTPVKREVLEAMWPYLGPEFGNPSSHHEVGEAAREALERARADVASVLGARASEITFTSGGTESDNAAVKGIALASTGRHVIVSAVEHPAVLESAAWLGRIGYDITVLPVRPDGGVEPRTLAEALRDDTAVVSIQLANNEVGTIQPVHVLASIAHEHGIPFHTDAVQAVGQLPVSFAGSGTDALTLTGHKIGGPMGVGALLLARGLTPVSVQHGGGQERDVRSGTLDAPAIAGLAAAVGTAVKEQEAVGRRLTSLRNELIQRVRDAVPDVVLNGDPVGRLPGNAHFSFPGCEGDALLMLLDAKGVECSTGSACSAGVAQPSHVLLAMGAEAAAARGSLRFTLGHTSTRDDVDRLIEVLPAAVERARRAGLS